MTTSGTERYRRVAAMGLGGSSNSREAWMFSPRGPTAAAIGALLIAVLVSGCNEDDGPESAPPSDSPSAPETSSPTTTPTETSPVEPTRPAEAELETAQGVNAFITYYFEVINYATSTGDVDLLSTLGQPSCDGCRGGIEFVERVYQRGGRIVGGTYRILGLEPVRSPSGHWAVSTRTQIDDQRVIGAGKMNRTYPAGRARWLVGIARVSGMWSVTTLDIL